MPIASRAGWLYRKMFWFAQTGPFRYLILELAQRRAAFDADELALVCARQDPLRLGTVLFEGAQPANSSPNVDSCCPMTS